MCYFLRFFFLPYCHKQRGFSLLNNCTRLPISKNSRVALKRWHITFTIFYSHRFLCFFLNFYLLLLYVKVHVIRETIICRIHNMWAYVFLLCLKVSFSFFLLTSPTQTWSFLRQGEAVPNQIGYVYWTRTTETKSSCPWFWIKVDLSPLFQRHITSLTLWLVEDKKW